MRRLIFLIIFVLCVGNIFCKTGDQEFLLYISTFTNNKGIRSMGNIDIIKCHRNQFLEELSLWWYRSIIDDSVNYHYSNHFNIYPSVSDVVVYDRPKYQIIDERSYDIIKEKILDLKEKHGTTSSSRSSFIDSENLLIQIGKMLLKNRQDQLINL